MSERDMLTAAGWSEYGNDRTIHRTWTKDGVDWYTEAEALHEVLTAERDAAIARAERAEAVDRDWQALRRDLELNASYAVEAIQKEQRERARAEAAEAMAASLLDVSPADAHDVFVHGVELSAHYDDAEDMGALVRIRAALRAHAAKEGGQ